MVIDTRLDEYLGDSSGEKVRVLLLLGRFG